MSAFNIPSPRSLEAVGQQVQANTNNYILLQVSVNTFLLSFLFWDFLFFFFLINYLISQTRLQAHTSPSSLICLLMWEGQVGYYQDPSLSNLLYIPNTIM
jgi:hypothetical protein